MNIDIKLKGFMIQLFSLTINNTYDCNFSLNKIVTLIKVSKPTAQSYLAELVKIGHIIKTDKGYRLSSKFFSIGNKKRNQIIKIYKSIQGCEHLTNRFIKTDWNVIKNPVEYWRGVEGGTIGKKSLKVNEEITINL